MATDLNRPEVKKAIHEEQAKGGEITWYISCDQVYPQPNYFIDAPAMDPVMVPWVTWRYGMNGILYWEINFWSQTSDPWLDPVTYLSGFLCSEGGVFNGEGSLIYPGSRTKRYTGQKDAKRLRRCSMRHCERCLSDSSKRSYCGLGKNSMWCKRRRRRVCSIVESVPAPRPTFPSELLSDS